MKLLNGSCRNLLRAISFLQDCWTKKNYCNGIAVFLVGYTLLMNNCVKQEARATESLNLSSAVVITADVDRSAAETQAANILTEEVARRTGLKWPLQSTLAKNGSKSQPEIILMDGSNLPNWRLNANLGLLGRSELSKPESYCVHTEAVNNRVYIIGSDARGLMFGVGQLLRQLELLPGQAAIEPNYRCYQSPDRTIRGHQLGYRPRANSWDAWTLEQFDQYFRDLIIFGSNCFENIPFQDKDPGPLMKYSREQMNIEFAKLCEKYDVDHWIWVPVEITIDSEPEKCDEFLAQQEKFYKACPRLDAIFVPGGDPGHNPSRV